MSYKVHTTDAGTMLAPVLNLATANGRDGSSYRRTRRPPGWALRLEKTATPLACNIEFIIYLFIYYVNHTKTHEK